MKSVSDRRGAILVIAAIAVVLMVTLLGLALDAAHVRKSVQELQHSAEAAALAATNLVADDDAGTNFAVTRQEALDVALANLVAGTGLQLEANFSNDPAGDVVVGRWNRFDRIFTPTTVDPDSVHVRGRRTSSSLGGSLLLNFGPVFGYESSEISRSAIAHYNADGGAAVLILDPTERAAFFVRGTASMYVPFDGIQVNSTDSQAFKMNGQPDNPRVRARRIGVTGNYQIPANSTTPEPTPGVDPIPDPLAGLPMPDPAGMTDYGAILGPGDYLPGYYPGGVDFNNGTAELSPGVYYFDAHGIDVHADARLNGEGVMLFIGETGRIVISGNNPGFTVSGPTSGIYEGVAVFQHRSSAEPCDISGGGNFEVLGTMYLPAAHLSMDGNVIRRIGRIIVNTQELRGTAEYVITGEGHPPIGQLNSYLVD